MRPEIIVAIITIIPSIATLIVSTIVNSKVKKQNDLREEIKQCEERIYKKIDEVRFKVDDNRKKELRSILVNDYTDLIKGKKKSKEQIQDISDMFDEYKLLGGDSYVDDLHDIWKDKESR